MHLEQKGLSLLIHDIAPNPIKIPSQLYPLTGEMDIIHHGDTAAFPDGSLKEQIKSIYNNIQPNIGTCYTNTQTLIEALQAVGIQAQSYVGWVISGGALPVHHCFASIENHVLDLTIRPAIIYESMGQFGDITIEELREKIANRMIEMESIPNSEKTTFGQVDEYTIYIASKCKPHVGFNVYQKLMRAHPNHPSYQNLHGGKISETQRLYYEKKLGIQEKV